ncbi:SAM-dependent methyltransferase [Marinimicrobium alkaliphilum]|uniref:SAM-dependent methyltransferase n=1 Tax=Marinimicrobium alkaliphilum TaxID=2202654 RepID=UPI000DB9F302|nr:cyclopropane-fatty-acyl-phospholipid synthase family protein [Marinimicrobium alkaliphilum]
MSTSRTRIASLRPHRLPLLSWNQALAKRLLIKTLGHMEQGCLRLHEGDECHEFGERADQADLVADIHVHDPQAYSDVAFGGSVGSGEAYMSGYWSSPNLSAVTRIFVRNLRALDKMDTSQSLLGKALLKGFHWLNRNTREGSRRNISAHYDLGNDFFKLFLDPTMMYSSAIYPSADADLNTAAEYKLQRICEKLELNADDHLLEIGTGWGGMAIYAARHYGCRVTTTTISREQRDYALAAVKAEGLEDRITVLFDDYRDLQGRYDKLVSVEMIEAVGHDHFGIYFDTCSRLLNDSGKMLIQAITIADQRYDQSRKSVDFIQRYIFPGGSLPSVSRIADLVRKKTDLVMVHFEDIGEHYARTLADWRERFHAQVSTVREQGFDDRFIRMWEFYLCYCEGGFRERSIGTGQLVFAKPGYRHPSL